MRLVNCLIVVESDLQVRILQHNILTLVQHLMRIKNRVNRSGA